MGSNHLETPTGSGLELDKMDIPKRSPSGAVRKATSGPDRESVFSDETVSSGKKHLRLMPVAIVTVLALLATMAILFKKQELTVSLLPYNRAAGSGSYLRVGPITATIQNDQIIRLSLDIECKNNAVRKQLAGKDSPIRDRVVSVITAPDTEALLQEQQFDAVKAKIKESLKKIYGESIGEIYFAELLTY